MIPSPSITTRPADAADAPAIVALFLACWHGSYRAVLPASLVAAMTPNRAADLWLRALADADDDEVLVAESASPATSGRADLAGGRANLASGRANLAGGRANLAGVTRWALEGSGVGVVQSLYVAPAAQGHGVGSSLLGAATLALEAAGATAATLWVFAANAPSITFYCRHGWLPDGATRVQAEFGQSEIRLSRDLGGDR